MRLEIHAAGCMRLEIRSDECMRQDTRSEKHSAEYMRPERAPGQNAMAAVLQRAVPATISLANAVRVHATLLPTHFHRPALPPTRYCPVPKSAVFLPASTGMDERQGLG